MAGKKLRFLQIIFPSSTRTQKPKQFLRSWGDMIRSFQWMLSWFINQTRQLSVGRTKSSGGVDHSSLTYANWGRVRWSRERFLGWRAKNDEAKRKYGDEQPFLQRAKLKKNPLGGRRMQKLRRKNDLHYFKKTRLYIPKKNLRKRLFHEFDNTPLAGHKGVRATMAELQKRYFWSHMGADIHYAKYMFFDWIFWLKMV